MDRKLLNSLSPEEVSSDDDEVMLEAFSGARKQAAKRKTTGTEPPVVPKIGVPPAAQSEYQEDDDEPPRKSKESGGLIKNLIIIVLKSIIVLTVIAIAVYFLFIKKDNTASQTSNVTQQQQTSANTDNSDYDWNATFSSADATETVLFITEQTPDTSSKNAQILDTGLRGAVGQMFTMTNLTANATQVNLKYFVPSANLDASVFVQVEGFAPSGELVPNGTFESITQFTQDQHHYVEVPVDLNTDDISKFLITYAVVNGGDWQDKPMTPIITYVLSIDVNQPSQSELTVTEYTSALPYPATSSYDATASLVWGD